MRNAILVCGGALVVILCAVLLSKHASSPRSAIERSSSPPTDYAAESRPRGADVSPTAVSGPAEQARDVRAPLVVHVTDPSGAPLPQAIVQLCRSPFADAPEAGLSNPPIFAEGLSDDRGDWAVTPPCIALCRVVVTADGYAPATHDRIVPQGALRVTLQPALALDLAVLNDRGEPIEASRIAAVLRHPDGSRVTAPTHPLTGGAHRILWPRPLDSDVVLSVYAAAPGYTQNHRTYSPTSIPTADTVVLAPAPVIRGVVISARDQRPVPSARVSSGAGIASVSAMTDVAGGFSLSPAGPSVRQYELLVVHPRHAPTRHTVEQADLASPVQIQLQPGVAVPMVTVDAETHQPVAGAILRLCGVGHWFAGYEPTYEGDGSGLIEPHVERSGMYRGIIMADGYVAQHIGICSASDAANPTPISLWRARATIGDLVDTGGRAISNAIVRIPLWTNSLIVDDDTCSKTLADQQFAYAFELWALCVTDDVGHFSVLGLCPGGYQALVEHDGRIDKCGFRLSSGAQGNVRLRLDGDG